MARLAPSIWRRAWRRFAGARRGNIAIIAALAAPAFVGALGLGVETGLWYYQQSRLQQAADLAAYAGASEKTLGSTDSLIRSAAIAEAARNGWDDAAGDATVNLPPTSGAHQDANSVEVLLTRDVPRAFSAIFLSEPIHLSARGVATTESQGSACMLALSPDDDQALEFSGNGDVTLTGCSAMANSTAVDAIYVDSSVNVTADCAYSAGGVQDEKGLLTLTVCAEPQEHVAPAADPYAGVAWAAIPAGKCVKTAPTPPLPGVKYCDIKINANANLAPGDYFIDGGEFQINGNAVVTGAGVTFHLFNGAKVRFNGTATTTFSAPTSGPRSGMLFLSNSTNAENKFNGTADYNFTGALYFPHSKVEFKGNSSGGSGCMQIVADTIDFEGNASLQVNCPASGLTPISTGRYARLAE